MTVPCDKPMLPSTKIVKYSDAIYKNRSNTLWMLRQNVHRGRSASDSTIVASRTKSRACRSE